jgi:FixJ family two-component response regulator
MNSFDHIAATLSGRRHRMEPFMLAALLLSARIASCQPAPLEGPRPAVEEDATDPGCDAGFASLTAREREVLQGVVDDKKSKQIADRLGVSRKTVDFHRANLMSKLRASSIVRLVKIAIIEGAVTLESTDASRERWQARMQSLHAREKEVLREIVDEKSSQEIALQLNISRKTVDFHRANLMRKLQARSLVHLIRMAVTGCAT